MNETLVKYLAGLLDADGSLSFSFKEDTNRPGTFFVGLRISLAASNTVDKEGFVLSLTEQTGMGTTHIYKDQFMAWVVQKRADLEMLLPRLIKHMVIKAQHWQWLLETWRELRVNSKTVSLMQCNNLKAASKHSRATKAGPLKPKNAPSWAWLAGYLDGDGWYSYRKHHGSWHIRTGAVAHINDVCVLQFLHKAFGGHIRNHNQDGSNQVWERSLGYQNRDFALSFLPKIAKHSRLKKHKILQIIHHHQQRLSVPGPKRVSDSLGI